MVLFSALKKSPNLPKSLTNTSFFLHATDFNSMQKKVQGQLSV